jgi:RNA polymerase-binding transcription factor DksA
MSFLRRLFGSPPTPTPGDVYVLPSRGFLEVVGEAYHEADLDRVFHAGPAAQSDDVVATLRRDPTNVHDPNAVEVLIQGRLGGYIPRDLAGPWSAYLAGLESPDRVIQCNARVWRRHGEGYAHGLYYINLRIPNAPGEYLEAAEARQRRATAKAESEVAKAAARVAAAQVRVTAREAKVAAATGARALAVERKASGLCVSCGDAIALTGQRGRPPVRCDACRAAGG